MNIRIRHSGMKKLQDSSSLSQETSYTFLLPSKLHGPHSTTLWIPV